MAKPVLVDLDFGSSSKVTGLPTPTLASDAVNKAYVDALPPVASVVAARIRRSTNQSIATGGSYSDLSFDTAAYQQGGTFWTSGATVTITESGYHSIACEATFDGSGLIGTITANMQVLVNGSAVIGEDEKQVLVGATAALWIYAQRNFTVGDTIKVQVKHTNATAVNVLAQGDHSPDIIVTKVGGAQGAAGAGLSDGDKGDITVSAGATVIRVDPNIKYGLPIVLAARAYNL